jgi:hypothetical protein
MQLTKDKLKQLIKEELENEFDLFHEDIERSFLYMASKDKIFKSNLGQFMMMSPEERNKIIENIKQKMEESKKAYPKPDKEVEF